MNKNHINIGTSQRPFPHAKPTQSLRDEDAFMYEHGSRSTRVFYCIIKLFSSGGSLTKLLMRALK